MAGGPAGSVSPKGGVRAGGDRIEAILAQLASTAEPTVAGLAEELVREVSDLYGSVLERVMDLAESGAGFSASLAADPLVAAVLALHGLHPEPTATRVERALAKVRPMLAAHGGDVELVEVDEEADAVLLRLLGSCSGCPASAITLRHAVEQAVLEAAPELSCVDVEEAELGNAVALDPPLRARYETCPSEAGP